ncbi:MAG: hypothetical protein ISS93_01830 [Candidatus Aenigmarchaeota archaeon]|nr:hypothetical protein [Candidatus Aenigmarchaeota archaeon]
MDIVYRAGTGFVLGLVYGWNRGKECLHPRDLEPPGRNGMKIYKRVHGALLYGFPVLLGGLAATFSSFYQREPLEDGAIIGSGGALGVAAGYPLGILHRNLKRSLSGNEKKALKNHTTKACDILRTEGPHELGSVEDYMGPLVNELLAKRRGIEHIEPFLDEFEETGIEATCYYNIKRVVDDVHSDVRTVALPSNDQDTFHIYILEPSTVTIAGPYTQSGIDDSMSVQKEPWDGSVESLINVIKDQDQSLIITGEPDKPSFLKLSRGLNHYRTERKQSAP